MELFVLVRRDVEANAACDLSLVDLLHLTISKTPRRNSPAPACEDLPQNGNARVPTPAPNLFQIVLSSPARLGPKSRFRSISFVSGAIHDGYLMRSRCALVDLLSWLD